MQKNVYKYLLSNFILPFLFSTVFFVLLLLVFQLFRVTEILLAKDVSLSFVLSLISDIALTFIPIAVPLSLFFTAIYSIGKLCSSSEYIALRSLGLSKFNIYLPYLIVSIIVSFNLLLLSEQLIPQSKYNFRKKVVFVTSSGLVSDLKSAQFFNKIQGILLFADEIGDEAKTLKNVFLTISNDDNQKTITANDGELVYKQNLNAEIETVKLKLRNGLIFESKKETDENTKVFFKEYIVPLAQSKLKNRISKKETMMTYQELNHHIRELEATPKKNKRLIGNAKVEYWSRLSAPVFCILLVLVGFSIGVRASRGRVRNSGLIGFGILIGYYVIYFSLIGLAKKGGIPASLTVLIPSMYLMAVGSCFYRKLDWQS